MANQNLSQFGEKLFVADADHTFIWDTAASISKRVSRNSWLNSGTLTSDAPITISQTWNNAAVAFTGLKFNATGTSDANSAVTSKLLEFQIGGVSKFSVDKYGITTAAGAFRQTPTGAGINVSANGSRLTLHSNNATVAYLDGVNFVFDASAILAWSSSAASSGGFDTALVRDGAANTLALRNGAAAQTFRVYNTYTDASNYERAVIGYSSNILKIGQEKLGTGTDRGTEINGGLYLNVLVQSAAAIGIGGAAITFSKNLVFGTDNSYDIGASGTARPRNIYVGSNIYAAGNVGIGTTAPGANLDVLGLSSPSGSPYLIRATGANVNQQGLSITTTGSGNDFYAIKVATGGNANAFALTNAGNVGIGTTSPSSKLQVTNGDVEIETVTSGIIMKAAGTANRYRITLNAGGTDFVITAL